MEGDELRELRARVRKLESDLERYHQRLEGVLESNRSKLLATALSVYDLIYLAAVFFGTHLISNWLDLDGFADFVVSGFVFLLLALFAFGWLANTKEKSLASLGELPEWDVQRSESDKP